MKKLKLLYSNNSLNAYDGDKLIASSDPHIEGTLSISKETVKAWIDSGTPGEGSVLINTECPYPGNNCTCIGKCKAATNKPKLDPQGNLLLEFGKPFKFNMPIYTVPSIPTYKEINDTATEYAEEKCRIMSNIKCLTARKTAYIDGYQKALKDLGHIKNTDNIS